MYLEHSHGNIYNKYNYEKFLYIAFNDTTLSWLEWRQTQQGCWQNSLYMTSPFASVLLCSQTDKTEAMSSPEMQIIAGERYIYVLNVQTAPVWLHADYVKRFVIAA